MEIGRSSRLRKKSDQKQLHPPLLCSKPKRRRLNIFIHFKHKCQIYQTQQNLFLLEQPITCFLQNILQVTTQFSSLLVINGSPTDWSNPHLPSISKNHCFIRYLAPYAKCIQLQSKKEISKNLFRLGELHVMSAMLKAQGKYINNSGLDESYTELEICDPATFRQINNDKHMKRSFEANTTLYVALFCVYTKSFVSLHQITEKELREGIVNAAVVTENFTRKGKDVIRKNHHDLMARCVKSVHSRSYSFWYAFSLIRTEYSVRM